MHDQESKKMLADLIWLNAVIVTEHIHITENTSPILHKSPTLESCLAKHNRLIKIALHVAQKYSPAIVLG